jgi:uridine phosphorylase
MVDRDNRPKDQVQYHIRCTLGSLAPYLLVPGDPARVPRISSIWDHWREVASNREFVSHTGMYKGCPISATSSGIGAGAMAIVVNEASAIGVDTFIRVGSTGSIREEVCCGDLIIPSAAVRLDGASAAYARLEYPAIASHDVLLALIEAAESLGVRYHVGIIATTSDFYAGQGRTVKGQSPREDLVEDLMRLGVLSFDMECATLFVLSNIFRLRAGAVCAVFADRVRGFFEEGAGEAAAIHVACEAAKILSDWDSLRRKREKRFFYPGLLR